jgi:hypothetical protein
MNAVPGCVASLQVHLQARVRLSVTLWWYPMHFTISQIMESWNHVFVCRPSVVTIGTDFQIRGAISKLCLKNATNYHILTTIPCPRSRSAAAGGARSSSTHVANVPTCKHRFPRGSRLLGMASKKGKDPIPQNKWYRMPNIHFVVRDASYQRGHK